ncbi:MAG: TonB-dependent receptor [Flavobacteriia bacterium]|nr:TonB-dependent receptor [Flavobacteriia bacterium]
MIFKSIFFFISFLFFSVCLFSQNSYEIKGKVIDKQKKGVNASKIFFYSDSIYKCISLNDGSFTIQSKFSNGKIVASYADLFSDTITLNLSKSKENFIELVLKERILELNSMDVVVGKFDKPIEEQTVSIEVIKPLSLEKKNISSIEQILDQTPGLNILDGEPQIRGGSGFTFGVGSKVALLIDDMPFLSGDAGRPEWSFVPVENIHHIEIIKGAASVLSGSAALSGSIHVRTNFPSVKPSTKISSYLGVYDAPDIPDSKWWKNTPLQYGIQFNHAQKIKRLDFVLGIHGNYDHGYLGPPITDSIVATVFPDTVSQFTEKQMEHKKIRVNLLLRVHCPKIKGFTYGINSNFMKYNTNMVMAWLNDSSGLYRAYPSAVFLQKQNSFHIDPFVHWINKKWGTHSLKMRYYSTKNEMSANQNNEFVNYYIDYSLKKSFHSIFKLDFILGASNLYTNSFANIYIGSGNPRNTVNNTSFYLQVEKKILKNIKFSFGGRYEIFNLNDSIKNAQPIFRSGINYQIFKPTFLRLSYGQGFRFPTITERFIKTGVGNMGVFPNTKLKPEYSWNTEFGIKQVYKFGKVSGVFDIAAYWQEYSNTIEYVFGIWAPLTTPQALNQSAGFKFINTGKSRVLGIDASLALLYKLRNKIEIQTLISYNYILPTSLSTDYIYAKDSLNREFSYKTTSLHPEKSILKYRFLHNLKSDFEVSIYRFQFGFSMKYFSKMENMDAVIKDFEKLTLDIEVLQNIQYMDFYQKNRSEIFIYDTRMSFQFFEKFKISFLINNVFNKVYSLRPLKIEAPRLWMLQLSYQI